MFGFLEQTSFLRCEFLYNADDDPLPIIDRYADGLQFEGLHFSYFKGNDSLLHYTLVDWSSGARRMVDIFRQVRALWHKRKHPGEWLYAAFRGDFALDGYTPPRPRNGRMESDRLELSEVGVRIAYNGRAFLGQETMSVVSTCNATGLLTGGVPASHGFNLHLLMRNLTHAWCETKPLFGWLAIGTRPDVDVPPLIGANRIPRNVWFAFYPSGYMDEMQGQAQSSSGRYIVTDLGEGGLVLENTEQRPADIDVVPASYQQDRSIP